MTRSGALMRHPLAAMARENLVVSLTAAIRVLGVLASGGFRSSET